jgi:hypothetical protein
MVDTLKLPPRADVPDRVTVSVPHDIPRNAMRREGANKMDQYWHLRVSTYEKNMVNRVARRAGVDPALFIRWVVLNAAAEIEKHVTGVRPDTSM